MSANKSAAIHFLKVQKLSPFALQQLDLECLTDDIAYEIYGGFNIDLKQQLNDHFGRSLAIIIGASIFVGLAIGLGGMALFKEKLADPKMKMETEKLNEVLAAKEKEIKNTLEAKHILIIQNLKKTHKEAFTAKEQALTVTLNGIISKAEAQYNQKTKEWSQEMEQILAAKEKEIANLKAENKIIFENKALIKNEHDLAIACIEYGIEKGEVPIRVRRGGAGTYQKQRDFSKISGYGYGYKSLNHQPDSIPSWKEVHIAKKAGNNYEAIP